VTSRIVLDASAAVRVVLRQAGANRSLDLLESASLVIAPSLICSEVANTFWKYQIHNQISEGEGIQLYELSMSLLDELIPEEELALEALTAAVQNNHPVYDMLYLIAGRRFGCSLLSADQRLLGLAQKIGVSVVA